VFRSGASGSHTCALDHASEILDGRDARSRSEPNLWPGQWFAPEVAYDSACSVTSRTEYVKGKDGVIVQWNDNLLAVLCFRSGRRAFLKVDIFPNKGFVHGAAARASIWGEVELRFTVGPSRIGADCCSSMSPPAEDSYSTSFFVLFTMGTARLLGNHSALGKRLIAP